MVCLLAVSLAFSPLPKNERNDWNLARQFKAATHIVGRWSLDDISLDLKLAKSKYGRLQDLRNT